MAEIPSWVARTIFRTDIMCLVPFLAIIAYYFLADATLVDEFNPNSKDKFDAKSSNKATAEDIAKNITENI